MGGGELSDSFSAALIRAPGSQETQTEFVYLWLVATRLHQEGEHVDMHREVQKETPTLQGRILMSEKTERHPNDLAQIEPH